MAEVKNYGLSGVHRTLQLGKQGPVLVGNADTDSFTVTLQDAATLTTMGGANASNPDHFITKAQLDVVYTEAQFLANVNYDSSSPILLGNISSGTKTIITTFEVDTVFDGNAVVTIGDASDNNLLMSDNYAEIEVVGTYQTINTVEFASNSALNIYVTQGGATQGAGTVLVSVVDGPVVNAGAVNYGAGGSNYGNSNVVTLLSSFGSNSISTIGNISANAFVLPGGGTITENVYGFAGSIRLKPIGGSATQYLEIAPTAAGDGDHVHLMAGGGTTELFLGDDNQYVKLASNGAIVVNSANVSLGNSAQWTFGIDGNLTLPGNSFTVNYANGSQVSLGGGGIALSNLSVSVNSPSGNGSLTYSNTTGVFTFTPANLSSVAGNYGNSNVVTLLSSFGSNTILTTGNVTANNFIGNISITGNVTGTSQNVSLVAGAYSTTFDNTGNTTFANGTVSLTTLTATGNITGNFFIGNGSQLTGIVATAIQSGTANVRTFSSANVTISASGNANVLVVTGTGANISGTANVSGNLSAGNVSATTFTGALTGNVTGSATTAGTVTTAAQPNITSVGTLTSLGVTGNISAGNISTAGQVSATGNITGGNLLTSAEVIASGVIQSGTGLSTGGYLSVDGSTDLHNTTVTGNLSATGNVSAGNVIVNGQPTTYGVANLTTGVVAIQATATGTVAATVVANTSPNGSTCSSGSNTSPGLTVLTVAIPTAGTWRLDAELRVDLSSGGYMAAAFYDNGTLIPGSEYWVAGGAQNKASGSGSGQYSGFMSYNVTTTGARTVTLGIWSTATTSVIDSGDGRTWMRATQLDSIFALNALNTMTTTGNVSVGGNLTVTGNVAGNVATTFEGAWTVPAGNSTQSFTVTSGNTYLMWVDCNIPNGIITWNATASITNTNVPVVGAQYAWVYTGGGTPIDFTSLPNQFVGTANTIVRSSVAPSATTNRFDFGINNTSGGNVTVRYGWAQIS